MSVNTLAGVKDTHTPARAVRIADGLWKAAKAAAAQNGESVSDVIRRALERYVKATEKRKGAGHE